MYQTDFSHVFKCDKCGEIGVINLIKVAGSVVVIKFKCPNHGGKSVKLSLAEKDKYISHIRDGVFRCYKCGAPAKAESMKVSGPWTLVRMLCDAHGNKLPFQKIWSAIYSEITGPATPQRAITTHIAPGEKVKVVIDVPPYCPYCKAPLNRDNAKWSGPMSILCPYCERTVPAVERKI
ncbi:MAG: hypothetical protein ACFFCM_16565 [Promethearchaeota archaeon]